MKGGVNHDEKQLLFLK